MRSHEGLERRAEHSVGLLDVVVQDDLVKVVSSERHLNLLRRALDALAPHETGGGGAAIDDASTPLDSALQEASLAMTADWRPTQQADAPATLPARGGEAVGPRVTEALDSPPVAAAVPAVAASAGSFDGFAAKVRLLREWSWVRLTPRASSAEPAELLEPPAVGRLKEWAAETFTDPSHCIPDPHPTGQKKRGALKAKRFKKKLMRKRYEAR